jgi:acetyl-CoA acetyltransferase
VAGATFGQALGWQGAQVTSAYAACASGATALDVARNRILAGLCDVALVVGADTTPKGFLAPTGGDRPDDPDWLRFRLLGATTPTYFAFYARRRMEVYGATDADFAKVKVKNARHGLSNPNARYRKEVTTEEVLASPMVADPLRLLEICATSDGAAAVVLSSMDFARRHASGEPVRVAAVSTATPRFPNTVIEMPNFATDSAAAVGPPELTFRDSIAATAYDQAGIGPDDLDLVELHDCFATAELVHYDNLMLCEPGGAVDFFQSGATWRDGKTPVNVSGGLESKGHPIAATGIANIWEVCHHLRGEAGDRQIPDAKVGLAHVIGLGSACGIHILEKAAA